MRRPSMPPRWRPSGAPAASSTPSLGQGKGCDERRLPGRRLHRIASQAPSFPRTAADCLVYTSTKAQKSIHAAEAGAPLPDGGAAQVAQRRTRTSVPPRTKTTTNKVCFTCPC
jgi:hypothetical protein